MNADSLSNEFVFTEEDDTPSQVNNENETNRDRDSDSDNDTEAYESAAENNDDENGSLDSAEDDDTSMLLSMEERLSVNDLCEMEQLAKETIDDYMSEHILRISSPLFVDTLINAVSGFLFEDWHSVGICEDHDYEDIVEMVRRVQTEYFEIREIPLREEPTTAETAQTLEEILPKIEYIRNVDQPTQRTPEWYERRYNLLTASNAWKIFSSPAQYNSLVYEKCKPMDPHDSAKSGICVDSNNSLQFGIRYEPLSIMLYEQMHETKVSDVGCIPHRQYPFLGASPDGIVMTPGEKRYGRMIEVKNIVNREITGVPLESYWIQMQLQMEVCYLDECDFIETRFLQYDTIDEIPPDPVESEPRKKGMVLYFYPRIAISNIGMTPENQSAEYAYLPLHIAIDTIEADEWIKAQCAAREKHVLYKKTYWVLDQFSCVLVRRNREWFRNAVPKIEEAWNTIVRERAAGYEHRASQSATKKKKIQTEVVCSDNTTTHYIRNLPMTNSICLVKLDQHQ
jgi:hypothetical protein